MLTNGSLPSDLAIACHVSDGQNHGNPVALQTMKKKKKKRITRKKEQKKAKEKRKGLERGKKGMEELGEKERRKDLYQFI